MYKTRIRWGQSLFALLPGFFFLFLFSSSVLASPEELEAVRQQIQNSGARWQAEETSISKLPEEQRRMRLGLLKGSFSVPARRPRTFINHTCYGGTITTSDFELQYLTVM